MTALFDVRHDDVAVLAGLHAVSFDDAWDAPAIAALLATPGTFAVWAVDGFILVRAAGGEAEILTLAVSPPARGRGLGRSLVTKAAAHAVTLGAESLFLEVADGNRPALALYAGLGFLQVGRRTGYYRGRDAAVMKVPLPLPPSADMA
jgi:ribosomal-protein-alanine N-acetyltransferase